MKTTMKKQITLTNVRAYITGMLRYKCYYSRVLRPLIREHILEQIDFRIKYMDRICYDQGSCKMCGCQTTGLQMANKACDKPCYPEMMKKRKWNAFKTGNLITLDKNGIWELFPNTTGDLVSNERLIRYTKANKSSLEFNYITYRPQNIN